MPRIAHKIGRDEIDIAFSPAKNVSFGYDMIADLNTSSPFIRSA